MNEEIRFEVGEKYENMKGVFEVIAIHRDSMEIRWESGEEISTSIALQQRIIERMQHEKELAQEKSISNAKSAKSRAKASHPFSGFETDDFGRSVAKTAWRGRGQLGGSVAKKLASKSFKFNSWAVLRKPEVHWLDTKRQKQSNLAAQAKFYARIDEGGLYFGFHVPATNPSPAEERDWDALLNWLKKTENETWLQKQCAAYDLYLRDLSGNGFEGELSIRDDQWIHRRSDKETTLDGPMVAFLSAAAEGGELDLRIEKRMEKTAVIERKQHIAGDMAALFGSLAPLYGAAAARNG